MNFEFSGYYSPFKTDLMTLQIIKSRVEHRCFKCSNKIPKGSFCLNSKYYSRTCLSCAENYLKNAVTSINEFLKYAKEKQKDFKKNYKKYQLNNTIMNI